MMDAADDRTTPNVYPYVVGGSLPLNARSYVVRQADDAFYRALKARQFCYVLNARQMGKSSLRVQTMARLQADGDICVFIDMTDVGTGKAEMEDTWYFSLLWQIVKQVRDQSTGLEEWSKNTLRSWWKDSDGLTFVLRWREFIEEELLGKVDRSIAIFVDEIDSTLALSFSVDDFFAVIRSCYQRRVDEPKFERLTFALLGVCTPQDLMKDKRRTPFNIGQAIELLGFSYEEAIDLAQGLPGGTETLKEILEWTGGQPFLTQRICRLSVNVPEFTIQNLIQSQIIQAWESNDEQVHFQTIQNLVMTNESIATALLGLYQRVLNEGGVTLEANSEQVALRLTGLVVKKGDRVQVTNRIYEQVFNADWVSDTLSSIRPYGDSLRGWQKTKNQSWLLRKDKLRDARNWAEEKGRKLSQDDYQFLQVSQTVEVKQLYEDMCKILDEQASQIDKFNEDFKALSLRLKDLGRSLKFDINSMDDHSSNSLKKINYSDLEQVLTLIGAFIVAGGFLVVFFWIFTKFLVFFAKLFS
jgi:hypothetical protein